jgi:hypothetical protein
MKRGKPQTGGTVTVAIRSVAHFSIPVSDILARPCAAAAARPPPPVSAILRGQKSTRFYTEVLGCRHRPEAAL